MNDQKWHGYRGQPYRRGKHDPFSQRARKKDQDEQFDWNQGKYVAEPGRQDSDHPPRGLRGRELGLWYAQHQKPRSETDGERGKPERGNRHSSGLRGRDLGLWHAQSQKRKSETNETEKEERVNRHPPGLRGRDIGMWYAQRSKEKKEADGSNADAKKRNRNQELKNRTFLKFSADQERRMRDLLQKFSLAELVPEDEEDSAESPDEEDMTVDLPRCEIESPTASSSTSGKQEVKQHREVITIKDSDSSSDSDDEVLSESEIEKSKGPMSNSADDDYRGGSVLDEEGKSELEDKLFESKLFDEDYELDYYIANYEADVGNKLDNESSAGFQCHEIERSERLDRMLIDDAACKQTDTKFLQMMEWRKRLPSYQMKQTILDCISSNQVVVISGETGCGKTTQVTQFILDDFIERGVGSTCRIVCTQPRRISAISVAERVADERAEKIGKSTGYQIRLEQRIPRDKGSILYCTTGIMLKWLVSDPWLSKTSHVILDEIHERDILSDFLMIVLKDLIRKRKDLKLVLMSATLNADSFCHYFDDCAYLNIPGYTFPVKEYLLEDVIELIRYSPSTTFRRKPRRQKVDKEAEEQYQTWIGSLRTKYSNNTLDALRQTTALSYEIDFDLVAALVSYIVLNKPIGAILIFVPGWEQIKKTMDSITSLKMFQNKGRFKLIPLHSLMPTTNQREVFERPPSGVRKIIVATNIAETSITIDDIVYVIDGGKIKMTNFDPVNNLSTLEAEWISRANAKQRRGRAGRVQAGECFHLYTDFHERRMSDSQLPEMLRTRLEELCLQIKILRLGKIKEFVVKAMQPPSMESLDRAILTLIEINALDRAEELTPLGYHLARMPVDPHAGKMLLFGAMFSCLDPILTIAASLSFKDAFYIPMGHEKVADERRRILAENTKSDHLMLARAYSGWEEAKSQGTAYDYCRYNYLSTYTLKLLHDMRKQFTELLCTMGFISDSNPKSMQVNSNSANEDLVKAIVCAGLYPNVARLHPVPKSKFRPIKLSTKSDQVVAIHPKSVNVQERDFDHQYFVFHLKMKTKLIYLYDCTPVSPSSLLFFGGNITFRKDLGQNCIIVDDWIKFGSSKQTASFVKTMRFQLDQLLENKITNPGPTDWDQSKKEGAILDLVLDMLTSNTTTSS